MVEERCKEFGSRVARRGTDRGSVRGKGTRRGEVGGVTGKRGK